MRALVLAVALSGLGACPTTEDVLPMGKDTYSVGSQDLGGYHSPLTLNQMSIRRETEFCDGQGKRMEAADDKMSGAMLYTSTQAVLTFRCVDR